MPFTTSIGRGRSASRSRTNAARRSSLADLGRDISTVITMLPTGRDVRHVLLTAEEGALMEALAPGSIVIDMSSSAPAGTRELAAMLAARGVTLVDAPVSGGTRGAEAGSLTIMIGSDNRAAVERIRPILSAMGQKLFETGGSGTGHAMKALNNFIAGTNFLAAAEALVVGRRFGLDPALMTDIINQSTGRKLCDRACRQTARAHPHIRNGLPAWPTRQGRQDRRRSRRGFAGACAGRPD